jgi:hypothetical protein
MPLSESLVRTPQSHASYCVFLLWLFPPAGIADVVRLNCYTYTRYHLPNNVLKTAVKMVLAT